MCVWMCDEDFEREEGWMKGVFKSSRLSGNLWAWMPWTPGILCTITQCWKTIRRLHQSVDSSRGSGTIAGSCDPSSYLLSLILLQNLSFQSHLGTSDCYCIHLSCLTINCGQFLNAISGIYKRWRKSYEISVAWNNISIYGSWMRSDHIPNDCYMWLETDWLSWLQLLM